MALTALLLTSVFMLVLWLWQRLTGNAAVVDLGWTAAVSALHLGFALCAGGCPLKSAPLALMGLLWGARLGTHLWSRVAHGAAEEGRYQQLRKQYGKRTQLFLFGFFQLQAIMAVLLVAAYLPLYRDPLCNFNRFHAWGALFFLVGLLGVQQSDSALARFKSDPARSGRVCQDGWWNYSRHPNYFFEILLWSGWSLYSCSSPWGWMAWSSPLLLTYLIVRVSGIPPSEEQSLRSRGDSYREYQRTTSPLIPWWKKP